MWMCGIKWHCAITFMRSGMLKWIVFNNFPKQVEAEEQADISDAYDVGAVPYFLFMKVMG